MVRFYYEGPESNNIMLTVLHSSKRLTDFSILEHKDIKVAYILASVKMAPINNPSHAFLMHQVCFLNPRYAAVQ